MAVRQEIADPVAFCPFRVNARRGDDSPSGGPLEMVPPPNEVPIVAIGHLRALGTHVRAFNIDVLEAPVHRAYKGGKIGLRCGMDNISHLSFSHSFESNKLDYNSVYIRTKHSVSRSSAQMSRSILSHGLHISNCWKQDQRTDKISGPPVVFTDRPFRVCTYTELQLQPLIWVFCRDPFCVQT